MTHKTLLCLLLAATFSLSACGSKTPGDSSTVLDGTSTTDPAFDSLFLQRAGQNAVAHFYGQIEALNDQLEANGAAYRLMVTDARDPRLYPTGAPLQPPTPADRAVVKAFANGAYVVTGLILERNGYFELKALNGQMLFKVIYGAEGIQYSTPLGGNMASVSRSTAGRGYLYVYYLRGYGNQVTPAMFDQAVHSLLVNAVATLH